MSQTSRYNTVLRIGVLILLIGLLIVNVLLLKQNRDLKAVAEQYTPKVLSTGDKVPSFTATTTAGIRKRIDFLDGSKTVLFVFSPDCGACELVTPTWRRIEDACRSGRCQVFGISTGGDDATKSFVEKHRLTAIETFANVDTTMRESYRISATPLTVVIDAKGNVDQVWLGAFDALTEKQIDDYFGIDATNLVNGRAS